MAPRALNLVAPVVDQLRVDASSYAFVQGIRSTRATLENWNRRPWPELTALFLPLAAWIIASRRGG